MRYIVASLPLSALPVTSSSDKVYPFLTGKSSPSEDWEDHIIPGNAYESHSKQHEPPFSTLSTKEPPLRKQLFKPDTRPDAPSFQTSTAVKRAMHQNDSGHSAPGMGGIASEMLSRGDDRCWLGFYAAHKCCAHLPWMAKHGPSGWFPSRFSYTIGEVLAAFRGILCCAPSASLNSWYNHELIKLWCARPIRPLSKCLRRHTHTLTVKECLHHNCKDTVVDNK